MTLSPGLRPHLVRWIGRENGRSGPKSRPIEHIKVRAIVGEPTRREIGGGRSTRLFELEGERGQVTAFVTIFTVALIMVIGLVLDGGFILAAKRQAINEAEQAARAGAQAVDIDELRGSGDHVLQPEAAVAAAQNYLRRTGHTGEVTVDGASVSVTVSIDRPLLILGAGGLADVTVTGTGTASAVRGVVTADS